MGASCGIAQTLLLDEPSPAPTAAASAVTTSAASKVSPGNFFVIGGIQAHRRAWTVSDGILEGTLLALGAVDCVQTLEASGSSSQYVELNPILGSHPSKGSVFAYFGGMGAAQVGVSAILHRRTRRWETLAFLGMETYAVIGNSGAIPHTYWH
ncbi:MAG TPA: hypothetical protein VMA75_01300 [Candidatus Paceibacterota bacterium]|nr:hypothetical protein [Candidatus Paceibacterota bacterium]